MKKQALQWILFSVIVFTFSCQKSQSKINLNAEKIHHYSGMHYGGASHNNFEYFIEESTVQKGDTTISKQNWYSKNAIRATMTKPLRVKIVKLIEKDLKVTYLDESYKIDNGFMQHHWQTKIENDSIYYSYHRNNQPEAVEEASAQLKDRPVMTIHSLPLYLKKIALNRNFTKEIYFNETFRPFTIKAVEEVEINIKGYGLMTCFYIYVISEDTSNDEEVRIYIDKKTKTIVSKEYIVHESNSTNNTFPKSTGYEALIDKDYEADISDPNNTDSFDYIGAAFSYINKSNDTLNALLNIDKAIALDTTYATVKAKLKLMSYAAKDPEAITTLINTVVSQEKVSVNSFYFMARQFIAGDYKDLYITEAILRSNLKKNPDNPLLTFGMARFYSEKGDFKKAIDYAKKAISLEQMELRKENMIQHLSKLEQGININ